jgi:hypothetical protein
MHIASNCYPTKGNDPGPESLNLHGLVSIIEASDVGTGHGARVRLLVGSCSQWFAAGPSVENLGARLELWTSSHSRAPWKVILSNPTKASPGAVLGDAGSRRCVGSDEPGRRRLQLDFRHVPSVSKGWAARLGRAVLLDVAVYRQARGMRPPRPESLAAIGLATSAHALWAFLRSSGEAAFAALTAFTAEVAMWLIVVTSVYVVLRLTRTERRVAYGEVFNPVALADAPGGLMILGLIPLLRSFTPLLVLAGVWRIGTLWVAVGALGLNNLASRAMVVIVSLLIGLIAFGATGAILWSLFPG